MLLGLAPGQAAAPKAQDAPAHKYGQSRPRPKPQGAVRVATYNLLNLFDHVDDPALRGDIDDMKLAVSDERARKLAEAIMAMDADIIGLQEIESLEALRWFRDTYLPKAGYEYLASLDVGYHRGVECSLMSRFKIQEARVWPDTDLSDVRRDGPGWAKVPPDRSRGMKFQRSPLMARVEVNGRYELTIFVLHHKSGGEFDYQREAEAVKAIELIRGALESEPATNLIVMGDFNAAPWVKSFRLYLEAGMIDAMGFRVIPPRGQNQDEARLYKTHESDRVLDYILLSSGTHRELVIGSPHVYGTLTPPPSYDWQKDPQPPGYASDHYPVIIDLMPRDRM
jgi:endonuclease/exonuclease/phosphatase family metal-dependent hydrolase